MPNRIIKESICTSDTIEQLSWFEEVVFYRLIVNCDDYGRFDGRASIIKSRLFPLKSSVTEKNVSDAINKLSTAGLVERYLYGNKPYLQLVTWSRHQQIRAKKSKYPAPGKEMSANEDIMDVRENVCNQLISDASICPRNPIQSESNNNMSGAEAPDRSVAIELTLNDHSLYPVRESQVKEWSALYPAVDVMQELRNMKGWIDTNPLKRKTQRGIGRFINSWLAKKQDRASQIPLESKEVKYLD